MKRKIIVGVIATVAIIAAAIFVGCIEKETPITLTETPAPPLTPMPTTTPAPSLTPMPTTTPITSPIPTLPMPGKWVASAEFGEFEFVVNNTGTGISSITYHFSNWRCGGLTQSGSVGIQRVGGLVLAPITNDQFTIVTNIGDTLRMTIQGKFDEPGMRASGTWEAIVGATRCVGAWNANYKEPAPTPAPTPTPSLPIEKYTLKEAIDKGLVEAEITGMGASSGDSINLELTRLTPYTIEIEVPKGTVLLASDMAQNMVVYKVRGKPGITWIRHVSKIVLDSSEPQTFILEAYCLDFHKENPSSSTKFSVGTLADPRILRILDVADTFHIASVGAIQTAIWIVTDDVSVKELIDRFPVAPEVIDNAMFILREANIEYDFDRLFT